MGWLKRFYGGLPFVREAHDIRDTAWRQQGTAARMFAVAQEQLRLQLLARPRCADPLHLAHAEQGVFSQHGEDGIIAEIFHRIGPANRTFVELGVEDGLENNTAYLLHQGWRGAWLEGNPTAAARIRSRLAGIIAAGTLSLTELFITRENVLDAVRKAGVPNDPDFLSIDLDRNTYWVWEGLRELRPRVVCVEYNAAWRPDDDWVIPYRADAVWDGTAAYGASLKAFERLGRELGYSLVGCDLSGNNAFLVREDLAAGKFLGPFDSRTHYEPPRHFLSRTGGYPASYEMFANRSPQAVTASSTTPRTHQ